MENLTHWLLQDRNITASFIEDNFAMVNKLDLPFSGIWINKEGNIVNLEKVLDCDKNYIFRCGTKTINAITQANSLVSLIEPREWSDKFILHEEKLLQKLKNGIFFNSESFNFKNYANLDLPLVNSDVQYFSYKHDCEVKFNKDMFIKPSEDNKFFTGGIIPSGTSIKDFVNNTSHIAYDSDQILVVSSLKNITEEYRFYIIDNKIITYSGYKFAGNYKISREVPNDLLEIAANYAKLYNPHEIFVMDLAQIDGLYKIVEYNCLNGASLYASDKAKLFFNLNDYIQSYNLKIEKTHKNKI